MAHTIETMAFFGKTPWHGLGTKLDETDLFSWEKASAKAGLDWTVELQDLQTMDGITVDHKAVKRMTDNSILGVVGPRYVPLQNSEAFQWFQPFLEAKEVALHTVGSLKGGSRIWVLAKLQRDNLEIAKGDEVEKFILLSHSHDGSLAVRAGFTPIRVVCQNTLSMAHNASSSSKLIRIKHTKDVIKNLENIRNTMNVANSEFEATAEQYRALARKSISSNDLRKYINTVLKVEDDGEQSTRSKNIVDEIIGYAESGMGNNLPSVKGTWWTAYNGVNEWLTYSRGNNTDNRLNSLWFGPNATTNKHALDTAIELAL